MFLVYTLAIIAFDYLITLDREIEYFWKRSFSGASILFLANRYTLPVYNLLVIMGYSTVWSDEVSISYEGLRGWFCT